MIKRFAVFVLVSIFAFGQSGCVKDKGSCQEKTVASEDAAMLNFAAANGITPTKHSSGFYYEIITPGSGVTPGLNSTVKVNYTGKFTNGNIFDQTTGTPVQFVLGEVIKGWQLGVPLIKRDGRIKLIIPSAYAYGCMGRGSIPGYSILYFEIELVDVL